MVGDGRFIDRCSLVIPQGVMCERGQGGGL